jgi:hypothetical protein
MGYLGPNKRNVEMSIYLKRAVTGSLRCFRILKGDTRLQEPNFPQNGT